MIVDTPFAPQAQRQTGPFPDLGWAYDPLDFALGQVYLDGGTHTILPGTAIATFTG